VVCLRPEGAPRGPGLGGPTAPAGRGDGGMLPASLRFLDEAWVFSGASGVGADAVWLYVLWQPKMCMGLCV
jgi:hypothetical protein